MSEEITIDRSQSEEEIYKSLLPQIQSIINPEEPVTSALANVSAILKDAFPKISWVGFYMAKEKSLFLGPFQGKNACTVIESGKGVCGSSFAKNETIIVEDVDKFEGHIACDSQSKSEIVIPIGFNGKVIGVLDLDSYSTAAFNETDTYYLEKIIFILTAILPFNSFTIL